MAKMKIYEIARSLQEKFPDLKSKDLITLLQENGYEAKSPQSSIEDAAIGFLLKHFNKKTVSRKKEEKTATERKEQIQQPIAPAQKASEEKKQEKPVKENKPEEREPKMETVSKKENPESGQNKGESRDKAVIQKDNRQSGTGTTRPGGYRDNRQSGTGTTRQGGYRDNRQSGTGDNRPGGTGNTRPGGYRDNRQSGTGTPRPGGYRDNRPGGTGTTQQSGTGNTRPGGYRDNRQSGTGDNRQGGTGNTRPGGYRDNRQTGTGTPRQGGYRDNRPGGTGNTRPGGYRDNRPGGAGNTRPGGYRDNRPGGTGTPRQGGGFGSMDTVKPEVKQSRAQRASKDSRSAKQRYGKGRGREDDSLYNRKKKKDPNRKGAFIKPEPIVKQAEPDDGIRNIVLPEKMTIKELATLMKIPPAVVIKNLFLKGDVVTLNHEVSYEEGEEIALEYNCIAEMEEKVDLVAELLKEDEENGALMKKRPPVVCVMGHVDHGKTSLLDAIRETHITTREAGGITQHIGAYITEINGEKITFLDTPGHEAFTSMRMRGAKSTDIAILVVAADDGVMPQTIEAISHAKAAGVEIIVAVNKIDKPSANIERVKQELVEYELVAEDWGGDTIFVPVSAHTKEGIDQLLEMIVLTSEVCELKANPDRLARGIVIEAQLDKGRGPVATILVQKGTLRVGDNMAVGSAYGKIRAMMDDKGRRVKEALPSTPVEILGLHDVPDAGEIFMATDSDKEARNIAETYISQGREKLLDDTRAKLTLDGLFSQIQAGNIKELNLIVKADVQGSVEAVKQSLLKLSNEEVAVRIIHAGVGAINESDVSLASASSAFIIGFNVRPDNTAKEIADREKVDVRLYRIIYDAIEDVEAAMKGMLDPEYEEKVIAHLDVRQIFKASGVGTIAGSYVLDGKIVRGSKVRVTREGELVFEGELASLKRFKDDVKEVAAGYECGLVFENFNEIKVEDQVEAYIMVEVPR